jgi:hypothetical protein
LYIVIGPSRSGCYKSDMINPWEWFRAEAANSQREPFKKLVAGLVACLLAGLVVWWAQDARASNAKILPDRSAMALMNWLGTLVGLGLFWGGGVLVIRPLTARGFFQPWLTRCGSVERLALACATALTLLTLVARWMSSLVQAWMVAALIGFVVLASAFGWKLPRK